MEQEVLDKLIEKTAEALKVDKSTLSADTNIKEMGLKSLELAAIKGMKKSLKLIILMVLVVMLFFLN